MSQPLSIRLEEKLDSRLERLAKKTGRTKSFYIKQAIAAQLEDLEDLYTARKVVARVAQGKEVVKSLADVERELDLEH